MRLTKLEVHGFKSFADATDMVFEKGVTAIVGPNGCGKSNVSDAVRWVLGEQRARIMRGGKMEDIIFQGSSARRPVNVAEVSLHFENEDGELPVPYKEVVITRRLSRSGDSEYLLNRIPCRLRDIQDLVRGTGLGAESGVVIESKMIDALLSDRPDERRELFEEAAGVGLYRDRRRSTERRLEETTTDLARLDDLLGEIQGQVRSLARQRRKAERHAELTARRFDVELTVASREMEAWKDELARLEVRVADLREAMPSAEERELAAEQARDGAHAARAAAEAQRGELARVVSTQRAEVAQLQGEIGVAEERRRNAVARRERAEVEKQEGESLGERVLADRQQAVDERVACEEELGTIREELEGRTAAEDEARAALAAARQAVEAAEKSARQRNDALRRVELDHEGTQRELAELAQREGALELERQQLADTLESARREVTEAEALVEGARAEVARLAEALELARQHARERREMEGAARAELARFDEELTSLQGKANALEALERERVGLAPAAARLLRDRETFGEGAILGPLSDFISAGSESAALVEKFLGATVHAVIVRDREVTAAIRAWHATEQPGPLLLLPLDAAVAEHGIPADVGSLATLVTSSDPVRSWVEALLGHVESVDDGLAFVDARGAVWLPGTTAGPGPLQRRAELTALRESLEQAETRRRAATQRAGEAREALVVAERDAHLAEEALREAQGAARRADEHRGEIDRRRQRAERDLQEAATLAAKLAERRDAVTERDAALEAQAAELGEALLVLEEESRAARSRLAGAEELQEEAREWRTRVQVQQAQVQARLQVALDRERRLTQEMESTAQRLEALQRELATLDMSGGEIAEQLSVWQIDLDAKRGILHDTEQMLADAELAVTQADTALADAAALLDEVRRANASHADELHNSLLRLTELSGRRMAIRERLETEWRKPIEDLMAAFTPVDVDDATLRSEAEELRSTIDALGPVNPLAIEEHEEEVKRLEFLTAQRNDLSEAKQSLAQAIKEIDTTARELFLATFTQVRENFRQIFMTLFGGGECDIKLENPDAPLDCDIEIHASPRGKRTQRIHLLSSGERALVACSLLFGIFLTRPSPFCLLDEVDAPLDDQNVGRFVNMLNQFKDRTQFIVITHNPRTTTEASDAVYGVTMQEPGVSSVVSVRMRGGGVSVEDAIAGRVMAGV